MVKNPYEKDSLADLANKGFSKIKKLSESSLISEKLSAINMLLFLLILGIIISFFLGSHSNMLVFLFIFAISLILSSISLLLYGPVLEVVVSLSRDKIEGLRFSIIILFIDLTIAIAGLLFSYELIIMIAGGILGLQLLVIIVGSFISITKNPIPDVKVEPSKIWDALGKLSKITGIIGFIINIILIIIKYIK